MACSLCCEDFKDQQKDGAFLDENFNCRVCGKLAGLHPRGLGLGNTTPHSSVSGISSVSSLSGGALIKRNFASPEGELKGLFQDKFRRRDIATSDAKEPGQKIFKLCVVKDEVTNLSGHLPVSVSVDISDLKNNLEIVFPELAAALNYSFWQKGGSKKNSMQNLVRTKFSQQNFPSFTEFKTLLGDQLRSTCIIKFTPALSVNAPAATPIGESQPAFVTGRS